MQRGIYPGPSLSYGSGGQPSQSFNPLGAPQSYGNQPGVLPPNYDLGNGQQSITGQGYGAVLPSGAPDPLQGDFSGDIFAPFDAHYLDNLNFENRFAAAEFGMLGNLTAGMANSPPGDGPGPFQSGGGTFTPNTSSSFAQSPVDLQPSAYPGRGPSQWSKDGQPRIKYEPGSSRTSERPQEVSDRIKQEAPPSLAIGSSAYPSPTSGSSPQGTKGAREDLTTARNTFTNIHLQRQSPARHDQPSRRPPPPIPTTSASMGTPTFTDLPAPLPRHRNPLEVYSNVTQPYSYTAGFHSLTALIQRRFSPQMTAHIAKALAAIRPSFISCTMKLNRDDLIFMEKCLQRTLWGLEEVIAATGTPTIVCRRTGEVVAVGKEFSILTGWRKDVLLGKAPNLNANTVGDAFNSMETTEAFSRGGQTTPRGPDPKPDSPVNIVSILDDNSACDFFDDYAHLAFGDSRGAVNTPCNVLKYRTADEMNHGDIGDGDAARAQHSTQSRPSSGSGPQKLIKEDGKVACMLCWTVKRDVFDIPMLFVMNVSWIQFPPTLPCDTERPP